MLTALRRGLCKGLCRRGEFGACAPTMGDARARRGAMGAMLIANPGGRRLHQ